MSSKNPEQILDKALIRCKKAQAVVRPFIDKEKVKAGSVVEKKMIELLDMTQESDYGDLTTELQTLNMMITDMQKGILEQLSESVETIERRMKSYRKAVIKAEGSSNSTSFSNGSFENLGGIQEEESEREIPSSIKQVKRYNDSDAGMGSEEITAIQQRFMDRLRNFFSFQRVAHERNGIVDPQGKIAAIKVKPHSKGGIEEKGGSYKSGYRQHDIKGKPIQHLSDLYVAAEEAKSEFWALMDSIRQNITGFTFEDVEVGPMKQRSRAANKAQEEYSYRQPGPAEAWLYDILRASVYCKSFKQMNELNKYLKENVHIVDCTNRFTTPRFDGYRDMLYYVSVPYNNGMAFICEIQVHHVEFRKHFGENSHRAALRPYFANDIRNPVELMRDLEMLLQVGQVDDNLMEFLLEATNPDQLKLFAMIFFQELEETQKSLELFKRVLQLEKSVYEEGHLAIGSTYLYLGRILLKLGDTDGALINLREAVPIFIEKLGPNHPEVAGALVIIGDVHSSRGDFNEAFREQEKGLEIRRESLGEDHILVSESHIKVAKAQCDRGEFTKSLTGCRTALKIQESFLGESNIEVTLSHSMLGEIYALQGEYNKAIECYNDALKIQKTVYGQNHRQIAVTLTELGTMKIKENDFEEAETIHRKALQIREKILGKQHPDCAISHGNIGKVMFYKGKEEEGLELLRRALDMTIKAYGKNHVSTSNCLADLGEFLTKNYNLDEAMDKYSECLAIRKTRYGTNHPKTAEVMNAVGHVQMLNGNHTSALSRHLKVLTILGKVVGSNHPDVANTYEYLGKVYESQMDHKLALDYHTKALTLRSTVLGKQHPATASSCFSIAGVLESKGDFTGATMAYRQALLACLSLRGEYHIDTANARLKLGRVLNREKEFEDAEEELRKVISIKEEILGAGDPQTAEAYSLLGTILNQQQKFEEACALHKRALAIKTKQLGEDHPYVVASMEASRKQSNKTSLAWG